MIRWMGLMLGAGLLVISCTNIFAPKIGTIGGDSDLFITEQQTPEDVLVNFRYAYIFHDSLVYSRIIDSSFVFSYYDPDAGGSGRYRSWGRDVELRTTGTLFRVFNNINVIWNSTVDSAYRMVPEDSTWRDSSFAESNEALLSKSFELTLDQEISVTGNAVFYFRKSTSNGKWRITQWIDESIF
ncbi:MAG: hypothetical protein K9N46_12325 [Candidatus Marinimicrobia bacterium]|nr:hypothetical protein [Candidatus Neomarinimicrobiota bacterium]MCF7829084.1 hypothetical protein [Candidatus Neomarinimicrobiota bacterium]MCF7881517.1 hypothetical protein [Candidatus Neomarinimicrobiota bacterium]